MKRFKKILVGVDLSWGDRFVSEELTPPNAEAVRKALWLAGLNSASVHFLFSLDLSAKAQELISASSTNEATVLNEAKDRMALLVEDARDKGIEAESHVVVGKSWLELIRQVIRNEHDLLIVGSRHKGAIEAAFLGSTGKKLLRKCPCPVWVTRASEDEPTKPILVAHDLRPVGDLAMKLGSSMAKLQKASLHVVHASEYPELVDKFPSGAISEERKKAYREEAERYIHKQLTAADLSKPAKVHFSTEPPDAAILHCVEQNDVGMLVMGTVGRAGIPGFITGNTAERMLPQIPCSLLAVKPPGFESPVSLG